MNYAQLKNSYLLGIQASSTRKDGKISEPVRTAMTKVASHIKKNIRIVQLGEKSGYQ
jgi:hypothetical protein